MIIENVKVMKLDEPNLNNRIYKKETIQNAISKCKSELLGIIGMSENTDIDLSKISHVSMNHRIENDYFVCDIKTLDTSCGKQLEKLLEADQKDNIFGFRTAGVGSLNSDRTISDDYSILSINYVCNPA